MAQHSKLYELAAYYDIAMGRVVDSETKFLSDVFELHRQRKLGSVLELACGPAYHSISLARQGIKTFGVDVVPDMIAFAQDRANSENVEVSLHVGDMRKFVLDEKVDLAICMFDSIDALTADDDVVEHFKSVAQSLKDDGLYLIQFTHPKDSSNHDYGDFRYSGIRDKISVEVIWATNNPIADPISNIADVEIEIHVNENGRKKILYDNAKERLFSPIEINLLAKLSGYFSVLEYYGDFNIEQPLDNSANSKYALILLKK